MSVTPQSPMVEIKNLSVVYGKGAKTVRAVDQVSLQVQSGEVLGIVGESGSGKSTLARCVMSLVRPTLGEILIQGVNHFSLPARELRQVRLEKQMVFQDPYSSLNPRMTIFSALREALETRGKLPDAEAANHVAFLMEKVGLDRHAMLKYPHEFSGGQRQRVALARALAPKPRLLVADEPVSALDVSIQAQILNLFNDIRREMGLTMIFVSHDLHVVRYLSDRVAVMRQGQVVEVGSVAEVMDRPQHPYTKELLSATPKLQLRAAG